MQDCEETRIMLLFNFSEYKNDLLVLKQWKGALNQHHTYFRCSSLTIRAQSLNFKRASERRYCPFHLLTCTLNLTIWLLKILQKIFSPHAQRRWSTWKMLRKTYKDTKRLREKTIFKSRKDSAVSLLKN